MCLLSSFSFSGIKFHPTSFFLLAKPIFHRTTDGIWSVAWPWFWTQEAARAIANSTSGKKLVTGYNCLFSWLLSSCYDKIAWWVSVLLCVLILKDAWSWSCFDFLVVFCSDNFTILLWKILFPSNLHSLILVCTNSHFNVSCLLMGY